MALLIVTTNLIRCYMLYDVFAITAKFDHFCIIVKFVKFSSSCYNSYNSY
jgi:hypothetical protein